MAANNIADSVLASLDSAFARKDILPLLKEARAGVHGAARGAAIMAFDLAARAIVQGLEISGALRITSTVQKPAFKLSSEPPSPNL